MKNRRRSRVGTLWVALLFAMSGGVFAAPLAEFTGMSGNAAGFDVNWALGQQFTLATAADITE